MNRHHTATPAIDTVPMIRLRRTLVLAALLGTGIAGAEAPPLSGAGASFPAPLYARWAAAWQQQAGGGAIRYASVGSGAGVARIAHGEVDFGGSDQPLPPEELKRLELVQFPVAIGGVVPVVNLAGAGALQLSGAVLADIYLGRIRRWDDPAIAALNPGLTLPSSRITVVHRADASGTSRLWSEYLGRASNAWQGGATLSPRFPLGLGELGKEGVASAVQRTRMAIGYVEYAYAMQHRLQTAALRSRDGTSRAASQAAFEAALAGAEPTDSLLDRPGAWPVVGTTFILLPARASTRTREVLKFFGWALRHGQGIARELDYVPLPEAAVGRIEQAWAAQYGVPD
ncbi:phosphate ABC transporter substrate-binding protein PstS [Pelomonas sp. KK5]|uniref:phosphate ABC transporter substrate-binding protein PstS n=1 Tax=Pelomonas sp. KK5 TaxID=1855730 RepID=UPI001E3420D2|nr:phosphate ABC transporter substrate-binding protein PstS [Pelomonas sp. KK5]